MLDEEFDRLLKICRLRLNSKERAKIKAEVDEVIKYFDGLDSIKCDDLKESYHPIPIPGRLRDDDVVEFENVSGILRNTKIYRFYVVGPEV